MNIDEMKDRIARAEEIQRYTENRCEALEKENAENESEARELNIRLDRLIKKNADLERKLEQTEKDLADYQFNYSTIKELEKENAGLKARLNAINLLTPELQKMSKLKTQQLTKAKEIIKRLLATPRSIYGRDEDGEITSFFNSDYGKLKKQAEQFLKEVEK